MKSKLHKSIFLSFFVLVACLSENKSEVAGYEMVDDHKIHYKISGAGEPIILLHGGYLDLNIWDKQVKALNDAGYKTIRFSDLGHGKTINGKNTGVKGYELIDHFIDKHASGKATLLGLSWGGTQAIDYTISHPDKVDKLILVSSGISGWEWVQDSSAAITFKARQEASVENDTSKVAELFYKNWVVGQKRERIEIDSEIDDRIRQTILDNLSNHWGDAWSGIDAYKSLEDLKNIHQETLILVGEQDISDIHAIAEIYHKNIDESQIIKFRKSGHLINIEESSLFNSTIVEFLLPD